MRKYIINTCFIANLLHPAALLLAINIYTGHNFFSSGTVLFETTLYVYLYSLLYSFPCFFISWLVLWIILSSPYAADARFLLWLLAAPLIILFQTLVIAAIANVREIEVFLFIIPSMLVLFFTILFRYRQFYNLIYPSQQKEEDEVTIG